MVEKNSKAFLEARKSFLERLKVSNGGAIKHELQEELDGISAILNESEIGTSFLNPGTDSYAYGKV